MSRSRKALLALVFSAIVITPAAAVAAPPGNDNFASAAEIPAAGGTLTGSNVDATAETGEPDHANSTFEALHSAWYRWTAPAEGTTTIDTCGSGFNTRLGVYTGTAVNGLTQVASNDNASPSSCGQPLFAALTFQAVSGTTYFIAVDTSGGVPDDSSGPPQGAISLTLDGPDVTAEPPPADDKTNPGTPVSPRTIRNVRIPRLIASCGDATPKGNEQCKKGPFEFKTPSAVQTFLRRLEARGIPTLFKGDAGVSSKGAKTPEQAKALRERGETGAITFADLELVTPLGDTITLQQGERLDIRTDETVTVRYSYFDRSKDQAVIAEEKERLREAQRATNNAPKSKCLPIAAGESNKQILDRFPPDASGYRSYLDMFDQLAKLGCQVEIAKYVRGKPSAPRSYVTEVVGRDAKRNTISIVLAQPGSHDFIFAIREDSAQWLPNQNRNNIPIGTDGQLTVSAGQVNRFTVQVIERASGRFVAGVPVSFNGKTQTTDGNGETTFTSSIRTPGDYRLSAEYKEMEGWRTIRAKDRGSKSFTSMAGRKIKASQGRFVGDIEAELQFTSQLPILPANLGTGDVGEVIEIPRIQQATVTSFAPDGRELTGQHNVVALPNNSNYLVGAGPGLLAVGGGTPGQVGRPVAKAGIPNPLEFLSQIAGGVKSALDAGVANVRTVLTNANQAAIAALTQALNSPASNLISDKGLGVISTGGGNLIGQAGGNLISDKGLGVISTGGGNLIGQAGGNLISDKGLGVISTGGGNLTPVFGGKVISTGGLN